MSTMYCALCGRAVEANRQIGVGTVALAVLTAGFSLLAVPFYPKRCNICKSAAVYHTPQEAAASGSGAPQPRLAELERRLTLVEEELEASNVELGRLKAERDFYSQLLGSPARQNDK